MLKPAVLVHELGQLILGAGIAAGLGHLRLDVSHAALDAAHRAGAGDDLGQHGATLGLRDLLAEVADRQVLAAGDRPGVRLLLAGDDLEQGCLAGAVRPHDRDAAARNDLQVHVGEEVLGAVALGEPGERDEAHRSVGGVLRRAPPVSKRSRVAMPATPAAFQAFSTEWALIGESQMARTLGPAPERAAPAAPCS